MVGRYEFALAAVALTLWTGCAKRGAAFRFSNPMLASASADPWQTANLVADESNSSAGTTVAIREVRAPVIRQVIAPRVADVSPAATGIDGPAPQRSLVRSIMGPRPAPHRQRALLAQLDQAGTEIGVSRNDGFLWLRQRVGVRTMHSALSAAKRWRSLSGVAPIRGAPISESAKIMDHVSAAQQSNSWISAASLYNGDADIRQGDLIVFDRTEDDQPASLVGLCIATDGRGVSEFFYVAGGVVRRGFVAPTRARLARDDKRRILNTYLRHNRDWPPKGTRFLSGELLRGIIR